MFWINEMVSPHANGLRALATMESKRVVGPLRAWANPKKQLPLEGQQPPMPEEWVVAQSAMRYAGMMKDQSTWPVLINALKRRPEKADATMESLMAGGMAILGMSLRAIGVGAAQGFSEWGDHRAFKPLLTYIEEPKDNEQSRFEACSALAWVAEDDDFVTLAEKIKQYSGSAGVPARGADHAPDRGDLRRADRAARARERAGRAARRGPCHRQGRHRAERGSAAVREAQGRQARERRGSGADAGRQPRHGGACAGGARRAAQGDGR
jgi:hypothetical protein